MAETSERELENEDRLGDLVLPAEEGPAEPETYKYQAFISYRHVEPDATIAAKIHTMIETFPIPKSHYVDGKKPVYRVFRDREELTTSELADSIEEALKASRFLIVICSKRTPLSPWCVKEIETFIRLHGSDNIIPVLVEGEPSEAFPDPLLHLKKEVSNDDGESIEVDRELLAAELRPATVLQPSFVGYETLEKSKDPSLQTLTKEAVKLLETTEKYRIMAAMLGVTYGDLKQRDKERRTRRLLQLTGVAAAALLVFGLFMFNAYRQANQARLDAQETNSAMMLNSAQDLESSGDKQMALLVARKAWEQATPEMPSYEAMRARFYNIMGESLYQEEFSYTAEIQTNNNFTFSDTDPQEKYVAAGLGSQSVGVWDLVTGEKAYEMDGFGSQVKQLGYSPDGKYLSAGAFDNQVKVWETSGYTEVGSWMFTDLVIFNDFSADNSSLYVLSLNGNEYLLSIIRTDTWEVEKEITLPGGLDRIAFNPLVPELYTVMVNNYEDSGLYAYSLETGERTHVFSLASGEDDDPFASLDSFNNLASDPNGRYLYASTSSDIYKFDLETKEAVFQTETSTFSDYQYMALAKDGKTLYFDDLSSHLAALDTESGKIVEKLPLSDKIVDLSVAPDNFVMAVTESGQVTAIRDGKVLAFQLPYGDGTADYGYLSQNGNYAIVESHTEKTLKIAKIESRNMFPSIEAQLLAYSDNKQFALFYNREGSYIWDTVNKEVFLELNLDSLTNGPTFFTIDPQIALSNDGKKILRNELYSIETEGSEEVTYKYFLDLYDLENNTTLLHMESNLREPFFQFLPDGEHFFLHNGEKNSQIYSLASGEVVHTFPVTADVFKSAVFMEDLSLYAENYVSGQYKIIRMEDGSVLAQGTGEVFWIGLDENQKVTAKGVFADQGFIWTEGAESISSHVLTGARGTIGGDSTIFNDYDPESDLLLTVQYSSETSQAVLLDFSSGELVLEIPLNLGNAIGQGFVVAGGEEMYLSKDSPMLTRITGEELEDQEYIGLGRILHYDLQSYDELYEDALAFNGDRSLSDAELTELGLVK